MPTTPGQLVSVEEVQASTIGDQVPTPPSGYLTIFPNQNGNWYAKNSASVVNEIGGVTAALIEATFTAAGQVYVGTGSGTGEQLGLGAVGTVFTAGATLPAWDQPFAYNLTQQGTNSVLTTNTAAQNRAALINLVTGASPQIPVGSLCFLPAGDYQFDGTPIGTLAGDYVFDGVYGQTTIELTASLSGTWISAPATSYYLGFRNWSWVNFAPQTTSGTYIIDFVGTANPVAEYLQFTGSASNTYQGIIDYSNTSTGGDGALLKYIYAEYFSGSAINVAGANSALFIEDLLVIGEGVSTSVGVSFTNGGAALMTNCQIIKCNVGLQLAAASGNTIASVFALNTYFDQCTTNALQITNSGSSSTVTRSHFIGCWFTIASGSSSVSAALIEGTNINYGMKFSDCHFLNTQAAATSTGMTVGSQADIMIEGCEFAGWANGLTITSNATAGNCQPQVVGNNFGASGQYAACTTGVTLSEGSAAYGAIEVTDNNFVGCTTGIVDNSTTNSWKLIDHNPGALVVSTGGTNSASTSTTTTALATISGLVFSLGASEVVQFEASLSAAGVNTTTTGGVVFGVTFPTGATLNWTLLAPTTASTALAMVATTGTTAGAAVVQTSAISPVIIKGTIVNGTTAGTVGIQYAAHATTTAATVEANGSVTSWQV